MAHTVEGEDELINSGFICQVEGCCVTVLSLEALLIQE